MNRNKLALDHIKSLGGITIQLVRSVNYFIGLDAAKIEITLKHSRTVGKLAKVGAFLNLFSERIEKRIKKKNIKKLKPEDKIIVSELHQIFISPEILWN